MSLYAILLGTWSITLAYLFQRKIGKGDVITALAFAVAFPLLMPYIAKLRTKKDKRTLLIDSTGIHTRIGAKKGDIPWSRIADLFATEEHIFILGRSLNGFSIPRDAFRDASERDVFIQLCRDYSLL